MEKFKLASIKKLTRKKVGTHRVKIFSFIVLLAANMSFPVFAQQNDSTASGSASAGNDIFAQMFEYSRPGKNHQVLGDLVGTWIFEGNRYPLSPDSAKGKFELFGTHVRKSFAEGRYFIVDMTFGDSLHKLSIPIQDGKVKDVIGKGFAIEGYDNVKKKFVEAYITNHIGSDIVFWEGTYDTATETITFNSEEEKVPGMNTKIRQLFIIQDKNHYTIEYYYEEEGRYVKDSKLSFTRVE